LLDGEDMDPETRAMFERNPINLFRALANNPGVMKQWFDFGEWIRWEGKVDPRLRELAILQVGASAKSPYEFSHHVVIGRRFGVSDEDLEGLKLFASGTTPAHFSALDVAVLTAARDLTERGKVDDALWADLAAAFDTESLLELVVVIGFYAMVVRVLSAVELDVEPDFLPAVEYLPAKP
jgi:alkylhydroperoxidase family enzyme